MDINEHCSFCERSAEESGPLVIGTDALIGICQNCVVRSLSVLEKRDGFTLPSPEIVHALNRQLLVDALSDMKVALAELTVGELHQHLDARMKHLDLHLHNERNKANEIALHDGRRLITCDQIRDGAYSSNEFIRNFGHEGFSFCKTNVCIPLIGSRNMPLVTGHKLVASPQSRRFYREANERFGNTVYIEVAVASYIDVTNMLWELYPKLMNMDEPQPAEPTIEPLPDTIQEENATPLSTPEEEATTATG